MFRDRRTAVLGALFVGSSAVTLVILFAVLPIAIVLYVRRVRLIDSLRSVPASVTLALGEFTYVIDASTLLPTVSTSLQRLAVGIAKALPVIGMKLFLFGFLPDALLRSRLAARTGTLPASLYFVGFTGGVLSVGAVGIIAGPLALALLVEVVEIHAAD